MDDEPVPPTQTDVAPDGASEVTTEVDPPSGEAEIVVYWRPACGYCIGLRRQLDGAAVPHRLVDIWSDPEGAAVVRAVARGHETVPTVVIGSVGLVNPSIHEVLAVAATEAPGAVPDGYQPPELGRVGRFVNRALGG